MLLGGQHVEDFREGAVDLARGLRVAFGVAWRGAGEVDGLVCGPRDDFCREDGQGGSLPLWHAFFENPGLVQFMHRMVGYVLLVFGVVVWNRGRKSVHGSTRMAFHAVMVMLLAQLGLGIATALTAAHLHVAITHQIGAILLWVLILRARYLSQYPVAGSIREGTL